MEKIKVQISWLDNYSACNNERQLGHYATGHRNPRPAQRKKIIDGIHKIGTEFNSVV